MECYKLLEWDTAFFGFPVARVTAEEINEKRIQNMKKPLEIIQIPFILAKDGFPISSTRIANKEIDTEGNVL